MAEPEVVPGLVAGCLGDVLRAVRQRLRVDPRRLVVGMVRGAVHDVEVCPPTTAAQALGRVRADEHPRAEEGICRPGPGDRILARVRRGDVDIERRIVLGDPSPHVDDHGPLGVGERRGVGIRREGRGGPRVLCVRGVPRGPRDQVPVEVQEEDPLRPRAAVQAEGARGGDDHGPAGPLRGLRGRLEISGQLVLEEQRTAFVDPEVAVRVQVLGELTRVGPVACRHRHDVRPERPHGGVPARRSGQDGLGAPHGGTAGVGCTGGGHPRDRGRQASDHDRDRDAHRSNRPDPVPARSGPDRGPHVQVLGSCAAGLDGVPLIGLAGSRPG